MIFEISLSEFISFISLVNIYKKSYAFSISSYNNSILLKFSRLLNSKNTLSSPIKLNSFKIINPKENTFASI